VKNTEIRVCGPPAMDEIIQTVFRFETFVLDAMRRSLRDGDRDIELRPKSFEVLRCLLEKAGRLVGKDEIIQRVWPNVIVSDESLTRCVSDVRLALGDNDQRIIKTIPRRGYLLAVPVSQSATHGSDISTVRSMNPGSPRPTDSPPFTRSAAQRWFSDSRMLWRVLLGVALIVVAVSAGTWFWRQPSGLSLPDRPSIAVLPFADMGSDPRQEYLSDGISEELTTSLSRFSELFVIAADSAFKYKGRPVPVKQIGRELGVRYLLQGSTRRDAERLRITVQLVEATTGLHLWAERYDSDPSGLFATQDEITKKIVITLVSRIAKSELDRALRKPPGSLAAHDYYLRGNALMQRMLPNKHGEMIAAARALYEQAIADDPHYAPAVQGLAITYFRSWIHPSPDHPIGREFQQQTTLDRAELLARKAVELDTTSSKAHAILGWILHWQNRPREGIVAFERAFEHNPNFVDGRFGALLSLHGRAPEAIEYMKRVMRLDPFYSPLCTYYLGVAQFFVGRYEEAGELLRSASAQMPDHRPTKVMIAAVSAHLGRNEDARNTAAEILRRDRNFSISNWLQFLRITDQEYAHRLVDGLRKAGFPE
jgi:adenylate cyclase